MTTGDHIGSAGVVHCSVVRVKLACLNDAANRVEGRGGNDRLAGGSGTDTLSGGGDAEVFVLAGSLSADRISGFRTAEADPIKLSPLTGKSGITGIAGTVRLRSIMSPQGADLVLSLFACTIIVAGAAALGLSADDLLFWPRI